MNFEWYLSEESISVIYLQKCIFEMKKDDNHYDMKTRSE